MRVAVDGYLTRQIQDNIYPTGLVVKQTSIKQQEDGSTKPAERWFIQVMKGAKVEQEIEIGIDFKSARQTINGMIAATKEAS